MQFSVVRLGKDSVAEVDSLNAADATSKLPFTIPFSCTQVEDGIAVGDYVLIWLGSDNNKGQPTKWKQGLRAIGQIKSLIKGASFNAASDFELLILALLPDSVDQIDFLDNSAQHYKFFSKYPIVGVKSSRNNAIQKVNPGERQSTSALLTALRIQNPTLTEQLKNAASELLPLLDFLPYGDVADEVTSESLFEDDDPVWEWISREIFEKQQRNFLLLGVPGTGKSWYAHQLAKQLTGNDHARFIRTQFHPSFSYDDFVQGYVPSLGADGDKIGFKLENKHFLNICDKARLSPSEMFVVVIDELTRGDPARVFGELLTFMEPQYRDQVFSLAYSGKEFSIPSNVIIIATANPEDRSVAELDDALLRRFVLREFPPDVDRLKVRLNDIVEAPGLVNRLCHAYNTINEFSPQDFGHAHFWNLKTEEDFRDLWTSRLCFLLKRKFVYDKAGFTNLQDKITAIFPEPVIEQVDSEVVAEDDS